MIEGQAHGSSGRFRARMLGLGRSSLLRGEKCLDLKCLLVLLAHAPTPPPARLYGVTPSRVSKRGLARAHTGHVNVPLSPLFAMLPRTSRAYLEQMDSSQHPVSAIALSAARRPASTVTATDAAIAQAAATRRCAPLAIFNLSRKFQANQFRSPMFEVSGSQLVCRRS